MSDDLALGNVHCGEAHLRRVFGDEVARGLDALLDAAFVPADCYRKSAASVARERVADQSFDGAHQALDLGLMFVQQVEQLFGAFAVIGSDHNLHDFTRLSGSLV